MKKLFACFFVFVLVFLFAACGGKEPEGGSGAAASTEAVSSPAETAVPESVSSRPEETTEAPAAEPALSDNAESNHAETEPEGAAPGSDSGGSPDDVSLPGIQGDPGGDVSGVWREVDSGAVQEYCPTITLNDDHSFHFSVNLLEGMGNVEGTYEINGDKVCCYVDSRDFSGFVGDTLTELVFGINGNELVYESGDIGITMPGASFQK